MLRKAGRQLSKNFEWSRCSLFKRFPFGFAGFLTIAMSPSIRQTKGIIGKIELGFESLGKSALKRAWAVWKDGRAAAKQTGDLQINALSLF